MTMTTMHCNNCQTRPGMNIDNASSKPSSGLAIIILVQCTSIRNILNPCGHANLYCTFLMN